MNWWQYLLLVNLYLILFYCFYALLLRRETFFQLNRVYLVSSALLSFFIPLIQAGWVQDLFITQKVEYTLYNDTIVIHNFRPVSEGATVKLGEVCAYIYLAVIVLLVIRLMIQLVNLRRIIRLPEDGAAYSFFKKIKLDMALNANDAIAKHEEVHAKQWHSADVLIMETVMILNWFNPVVYFYRRAIKHIHEFIADNTAVKTSDKSDYALLLLSQNFNIPKHQLVNHFFNGSLLKQRLVMLQKNRSHRAALLKYGLSAPLFILMMVMSSATVYNSRAVQKVNTVAQVVFNQPLNGPTITILPPVVKKPDTTNAPKTVTLTLKADTGQKLSRADIRIDSAIKRKIDSARTLTLIQQLPGVTVSDNGSIVTQGHQVTQIRINGQDITPDNVVFSAVEDQPRCADFNNFLAKNLKYPADAREKNIQGKAIVTFIVEKDGSLSDLRLLQSPCESLGTEALRVVSMSPKWTPGYQNGHAVRVQMTVPIAFTMDGNTSGLTLSFAAKDTNKNLTNLVLGTARPIYIVDGKEVKQGDFYTLDPNTIESLTILKDKSAKALYGTKAVNGVIIVKTKKQATIKDKLNKF